MFSNFRLDSAEALLFTWIRSYLATNSGLDEHSHALIQLLASLENGRGLSFAASAKEVDVAGVSGEVPGMRVWLAMSAM